MYMYMYMYHLYFVYMYNIYVLCPTVVSQEYFIYINDFNPLRNQTNAGKKLYMNVPKQKHGRGKNPPRRLLSGEEATYVEDPRRLLLLLSLLLGVAMKRYY